MKLAIVGSRALHVDVAPYVPAGVTCVISGGAAGIDWLAERYADERRLPKLIIRPDYARYGRAAPLLRNRLIVERADCVLAIWDGASRGTKYTVDYARSRGKPVLLHILPIALARAWGERQGMGRNL